MPRRRKKIIPMKYPHGHEYTYRTILLWLSDQLKKAIARRLTPLVPRMTREAADIHKLPRGLGEVKQDAWSDELHDALEQIAEDMVSPKIQTFKKMTKIGPQVNQYNKEEWRKLIRRQYGVNPTNEDPAAYAELLRDWSRTNAALINDIPDKTLMQIRDLAIETLMGGDDQQEMEDGLNEIFADRTDVSDSRCRLIARDQVAKLNGQLTQSRQTDLGIDSYVWRTVGDERVRETHDSVDGQTFPWSSPPDETDGNHPGEDYQCRCWAEPVLPDTLEVTAELLDEEPVSSDLELEDA
jgi:SPP1 gp7 family putative phage head morphogenesis protein